LIVDRERNNTHDRPLPSKQATATPTTSIQKARTSLAQQEERSTVQAKLARYLDSVIVKRTAASESREDRSIVSINLRCCGDSL